MKVPVYILFLACSMVAEGLFAQNVNENELTKKYLEEAKSLNKEGKYEEANVKFRQILALNKVIPTDMCYHFAETLYAIGQYQNSKNFIDKYFDLTGNTGDNYQEVTKLSVLVDEKLKGIKECHRCDNAGYRFFPCETCQQTGAIEETCYYCNGHGLASCSKCHGDGVLITANALGGNDYHTCDRCEGEGLETCPVCQGEKVLSSLCPTCKGRAFETGSQLCDHKDHPEDGFIVPYTFEKSSN